jgi:hypothetical protein
MAGVKRHRQIMAGATPPAGPKRGV